MTYENRYKHVTNIYEKVVAYQHTQPWHPILSSLYCISTVNSRQTTKCISIATVMNTMWRHLPTFHTFQFVFSLLISNTVCRILWWPPSTLCCGWYHRLLGLTQWRRLSTIRIQTAISRKILYVSVLVLMTAFREFVRSMKATTLQSTCQL